MELTWEPYLVGTIQIYFNKNRRKKTLQNARYSMNQGIQIWNLHRNMIKWMQKNLSPESCQAPIWPSLQVWDNERLCGAQFSIASISTALHPFVCTVKTILHHTDAFGCIVLQNTELCNFTLFCCTRQFCFILMHYTAVHRTLQLHIYLWNLL